MKRQEPIKSEDIVELIEHFGKSILYKDKPVHSLSAEDRNFLWTKDTLLTFEEFVKDPNHMNFPTLSDRQKAVSDFMIGPDPKNAFDIGNYLSILAWGKGSGKDTMAYLITNYVVYLLLNISDPQLFFSLAPIDSLDIINVAASGEQAKDVYFYKFSNSVKQWNWLRSRYKLIESGVPLSKDVTMSSDTVKILSNAIIFPKKIRAISGHCVTGDSLIYTNNGIIQIKDLQKGNKILTFDNKYETIKTISKRQDQVYNVILKNGLMVKTTLDHPFFTIVDNKVVYKKLSEIKEGDILWFKPCLGFSNKHDNRKIVLSDCKSFKNPSYKKCYGLEWEMTPNLAWLLGILYTEGAVRFDSIKGHKYAGCVNSDIRLIDKIRKILETDLKGRFTEDKRNDVGILKKGPRGGFITATKKASIFQFGFIEFLYFLKELDFFDCNGQKQFPTKILQMDDEIVKNFVAGLFDGDGTLGKTIKFEQSQNKRDNTDFVGFLSFILHNYGIPCNFLKYKNCVHLSIPKSYHKKFLTIFPVVRNNNIMIHKENTRFDMLRRFGDLQNVIAHEFYKVLDSIKRGLKTKFSDSTESKNLFRGLKQKLFSIEFIKKRQYLLNNNLIKFLLDNNIVASEVYKIEKRNIETVYNFYEPKTQAMIVNNILTLDSEQETMEGKNIIAFILDEFSAFKDKSKKRNAGKIFRMLSSSADSRFGTQYKGFVISYPRYDNDPILRMYEWSKDKLHVYGDKAATWDVKPRSTFHSKEDFEFEWEDEETKSVIKFQIPMDLKGSFDEDPVAAMGSYGCRPPLTDSPFIPAKPKISGCVDPKIVPIVTFEDYIDNNRIKKKITGWNYAGRYDSDYIITVDLGSHNCAASVAVMRKIDIPEVVAITRWLPSKEKGIEVDLDNVDKTVLEIAKTLRARGVYFDRWNSMLLYQKFNDRHFHCELVSLYDQDYKNFRSAIFSNNIRLINNPQLINEIYKLETGPGGRVKTTEFKDMADSVITGYKVLTMQPQDRRKYVPEDEGEIISENLSGAGSEDYVGIGNSSFRSQDPIDVLKRNLS